MDGYAQEWEREKVNRRFEGFEEETFGRCFMCEGDVHKGCIGVPCECSCPLPDERELQQKRQKILDKLSVEEQKILGVRE